MWVLEFLGVVVAGVLFAWLVHPERFARFARAWRERHGGDAAQSANRDGH